MRVHTHNQIDIGLRQVLIDTLINYDLYILPSNVYVSIADTYVPLKERQPLTDTAFLNYKYLGDKRKFTLQELARLEDKVIVLTKHHFKNKGKKLIEFLEDEFKVRGKDYDRDNTRTKRNVSQNTSIL